MQYEKVIPGVFLSRPNRFIAIVRIDGREERCHVKNTGRCRELLVPGAAVYLSVPDNPARKTKYDLIAADRQGTLVNLDSQAPNAAALEYLPALFPDATLIRPETVYGSSRFDFYIEAPGRRCFVEVKGCTLERNGTALFPDAPTERGVKHLRELESCLREGCEAYLLFVVQMAGVRRICPNDGTAPEFGEALRSAEKAGVKLLAAGCTVTPSRMEITYRLPVVTDPSKIKDCSLTEPVI